MTTHSNVSSLQRAFSKVPEVTIYFWLIKVMATTVGETAADFLNGTLGLGLTVTTVVTVAALALALFYQFRADRYVPSLYWLVVTLVSVAGTLITDNLTDAFGVPLALSTTIFAVALVAVFVRWYLKEKTLSIHSIRTKRREAFYWLAILVTFALGTAAGDWLAEGVGLGYAPSALIYAAAIAVVVAVHFALQAKLVDGARRTSSAVVTFWIGYILTRPLGASMGDLLSQPTGDGGLGLTTTGTSAVFFAAILGLVVYLTKSKRDLPA